MRKSSLAVGLVLAAALTGTGCAASPRGTAQAQPAEPAFRAEHGAERAAGAPRARPDADLDGLNAGELFARACGTTDFDACRPLTPELLPLWERAIAENREIFFEQPSTPAGLVAGVRAATGLDVIGAPAEAAELFRAVADAYAGDDALAPYAEGAARGVDSDRSEFDARIGVIAPLLEHAADADMGALALDRALADWERIATSPHLALATRAPAIVAAMKLARTLDDEAARTRLVALARRVGAPPGTRAEVEWVAATFEWTRWDAHADDVGENQRLRLGALPAISAFYTRWRDVSAAAPWVVEAAWAASELTRSDGARDRRTWLGRVGVAWPTAEHSPIAEPTLRADVRDHAALAALGLLVDDLARDFDGWGASCAALAPAAVFHQIAPTTAQVVTHGAYDDKAELAARWEARLDALSETFHDSPALAAWQVASARPYHELLGCLRTQQASPATATTRYRIDRELELVGDAAARHDTLAIAWGGMSPAAIDAQQRLVALSWQVGGLAVEASIRRTLLEARLSFASELPGAGAIWMARGIGPRVADDPGLRFAPR